MEQLKNTLDENKFLCFATTRKIECNSNDARSYENKLSHVEEQAIKNFIYIVKSQGYPNSCIIGHTQNGIYYDFDGEELPKYLVWKEIVIELK